jgi:hypothetical protein
MKLLIAAVVLTATGLSVLLYTGIPHNPPKDLSGDTCVVGVEESCPTGK